jgi:hypothetical protein
LQGDATVFCRAGACIMPQASLVVAAGLDEPLNPLKGHFA